MLSTIHLRTFLSVVDSGNYSAAAEQLHMSQPAVSQQIHALETQLDVKLFRRVGQQMVLTHAGEELVSTAREMLTLAARAEETIKALRGQVSGRALLGCPPSGGDQLVAPLLAGFRARFPAIDVAVTVAPYEVLLEWLTTQRVQLLLLDEAQRRRGWESQAVGSEPLLLLAPRGHALLQQDQNPPGVLRETPLILPRPGTPLRRSVEDALRRRGVAPGELQVALETDSVNLAARAVREGLGLAFVPQSRAPRGRDTGVVEIAGVQLTQDWHIVRTREPAARAAQELFSFLTGPDARKIFAKEGLKARS